MSILHLRANRNFSNKNYDSALKQYLKLLDMAINSHDIRAPFYAERLGDCYEKSEHHNKQDREEDHHKAGKYYIKSADMYRKLHKNEKAGLIYEKGAKTYEEVDDYENAGLFFLESSMMFNEIRDYVNASFSFFSAAKYFEKCGEYKKAARAYEEATVADLRVHDTSSAASSFKKAAVNYTRMNEYSKAIDSYASSVELDSMNREYLAVADTYAKMAACYYELSDVSNSVYYHRKSADLRTTNNEFHNAAKSYNLIGQVYENDKQYNEAIEAYEYAAKTYFKANSPLQEGSSYAKAARVNEKIEAWENSADYYVESAKSNTVGENAIIANDNYMRAAQMYLKAALEADSNLNAGLLTQKAAECYHDAGDMIKAAQAYSNYAELMMAAGEMGLAYEGFMKAAEMFMLAGRIWDAAEAYVNHESYDKAVELYEKYAQKKEIEKDEYGTGIAYMESANCYRRLDSESMLKTRLDKAISHFSKFLQAQDPHDKSRDTSIIRGDALRKMAECEKRLDEFTLTLSHLNKSIKLYTQANDQMRCKLSQAYLKLVEGIKSIDHGYYNQAENSLKESINLFKEQIASDVWKREYTKILKEHMEESAGYIEKIKLKPEVTLEIDRRSYTFAKIPVILNVKLSNNGKYTMKDINFLEHLPEEIKLTKLPDPIPAIDPTKMFRTSIELTPTKTGFQRLKPLEVYYEDQKGHRYVKASSEISLEVVEAPLEDFKNYQKAVDIFDKYAKSQRGNENWFQAGNGFRKMGEIYGKFRTDERLKRYWTASVECYKKYTEGQTPEMMQNLTNAKRMGDAFWYLADGMSALNRFDESARAYQSSTPFYMQARMDNLANRSFAFYFKADATKSIKVGDYTNAAARLTESLKYFDQVMKQGGMTDEEIMYVSKHEDEAKNMLETIKSKPEILVMAQAPMQVLAGQDIPMSITIENPLDVMIKNVKAVIAPGLTKMELIEKPQILDEVGPGRKAKMVFSMRALEEGKIIFKPMDISYEDEKGNAFMKGSNELEIDVAPRGKSIPAVADDGMPLKKEVTLDIDRRSYTFVNVSVIVKIKLLNNTDYPIRNINFLQHIPEQMKVTRLPDPIKDLEQGGQITTSVELSVTQQGVYRISPIELYYEDPSGTRYVKGSNEMSIEVVEKPPTDFKSYMNAVGVYEKYAKNQAENENWFEAGNGFMEMAEIYGKFRTDERLDEYLEKSIDQFKRHLSETDEPDENDIGKLKRWGDAHWKIGLGYTGMRDFLSAADRYEKSAEIYGVCGMEHLVYRSHALAFRMKAVNAIKSGDYETGQTMIDKSLAAFNEAATRSQGFSKEDLQALFKEEADTKSLLDSIRSKPDLSVDVEAPKTVSLNTPFRIVAKVSNPLEIKVTNVKPVIKTVEGIEIERTVHDKFEIEPGAQIEFDFMLRAKRPGRFRFHPVEITYFDNLGNAYQRGTDEIEIMVEEPIEAPVTQSSASPVNPHAIEEETASPIITLIYSEVADAKPGQPMELKGVLENKGSAEVFGLRFIGKTVDGLEIIETPKALNSLPPGSKIEVRTIVKLEAKGAIEDNIIEMFYKNTRGKRFFKSCETVSISSTGFVKEQLKKAEEGPLSSQNVMERTAQMMSDAKDDSMALISISSDHRPQAICSVLKELISGKGMGGVYINLSQPTETIVKILEEAEVDITNLFFIDCISRMTGKSMAETSDKVIYVENPSSLEEISLYLERMLTKVTMKKKFIFLDSLSSLLIYNSEKTVKEFTHFIINRTRMMGHAGIILSTQKKEVEELVKTLSPMCDIKIVL